MLDLLFKKIGFVEVGGMAASSRDYRNSVVRKCACLGGIFGCFWALIGPPGVTGVCFAPPGGG